jgi:O-antigen/teichoic acid export membrane protein
VARIIAFAATIYIARVLGAEGYGVVGFATAVLLYLTRIADAGAELGLGVREIAARPELADRLASSMIGFRLLLSLGLTALTASLALAFLPSPDNRVLAAYALTLLAVGFSTRWVHLGLERSGRVALARVLGEGAMLVIVLAVVHSPGDLVRVPLAQLAGDLLAGAILLVWLRRLGHRIWPALDWKLIRPILRRALPLVASALLGLMIYNADFIFLRVMRGPAEVGYYAAAYTLISFLINLGIAYSLSLLPTLTRLATEPENQRALYHTASAHVFAAALPVAIGGFLLAPGIIALFFGADYAPGVMALQILVWSIPLSLVRDVPIIALMASGREDWVLRTSGAAAASNLVLNALLIPRYGVAGAALATVVTEGARLVLALRLSAPLGFGRTSVARYWRSALAGLAMAGAILVIPGRSLPIAVPIGVLVYLGALISLGGVRLRGRELPELTV